MGYDALLLLLIEDIFDVHHSVLGVQHHSRVFMEPGVVALKKRPGHPQLLHALVLHDWLKLFVVPNQHHLADRHKVQRSDRSQWTPDCWRKFSV